MNVGRAMALISQYGTCPECGNAYIANGDGKLIINDDKFYRSCKCGWEITLPKEEETK